MTISKRSRLLTGLLAAASATTLAAMLTPAAAQTAETQQIELSARPLSEALVAIGRAFDVSVIAASELTQGKTAPPLSGELTADQAVGELLKGSGLIAAANESGDFIITRQIEELPSPRAASAAFVEDQVVVTGTRIARTAVNSPAPIDIVTAD
ncbi:MAG: STN domain-containing protein, partial [Pseudomonadota bacterium]